MQYLRTNDGYALFHDQGTGKTLCILTRLAELGKAGLVRNALVVAPKSAMGAWYRDIEHFPLGDRLILTEIMSVINYESVWRKGKGYDRDWDCIVLDESHKIKNRSTKQAGFLLEKSLTAKYRYILTGTPINNAKIEEAWAQIAFLDPYLYRGHICSRIFKEEWEKRDGKRRTGSYTQFLDRYCILDQNWKPYRYINVDEFQEIFHKYSHRVLKEEALDLPDKLPDQILDIELAEKRKYKQMMETSVIKEMDLLAEIPLVRSTKLRQICSGFIIDENKQVHELKTEKEKVLEEFLENWNKKLVIFAHYKVSIDRITKVLDKLKIQYVVLDGEQKDKQIWRKFQSDENIQVFVAQYDSANAGIDLFSADTIIYYEPTQSSTVLEQSRDRIHRIGQKNKCSYIHFITKGTIEEDMYKALKNFQDYTDRLFTEYVYQYTRTYAVKRRK